jgi:hypothetical protein
MLAIWPGALTGLQPPDHIAEELRREISPTALLDYEIRITDLMHRALRFPPMMHGESRKASDSHLKAAP